MRSRCLPIALVCCVIATPALAGTLGLGANLGFSSINPENGRDAQVVAWPSSVIGFQPGFRLSYIADSGTHEGYLDSGLLRLSGGGEATTYVELSGNYQYNFASGGRTRPYLTAGVGIFHVSLSSDFGGDESGTSALFGGGVGIRHSVSADHGSLRFEARFDRVEESDVIGAAGVFGFKFGYDLWMR